MNRVLKYGTGDEVPDEAIYLCTVKNGRMTDDREFVWHYFLVKENQNE